MKKAMEFNLTLDRDCDGLLDCDPWPCGNQFYGDWHWEGAATHCNGYWLAALEMAERMAEAYGDTAFAHVCRTWFALGQKTLEEKLWNGDNYLLWNDTATGKKCDTILSNQLSGQYLAGLHGLGDVFPKDRVKTVLETVKNRVVPLSKHGVRNAIKPDGTVDTDGKLQSTGIFTGETVCLAATYAYAGDKKTADECASMLMDNIIFGQRVEWDLPNNVDPETGKVTWGNDFYQVMVLWSLATALSGRSIEEYCAPGGLVDRIMQAAK